MITSLFILLLVACASSDIKAGIVPDLILIFIAVLGVICFLTVEGWSVTGLITHIIGAFCVSVPMLILALIIKGAFGGGDIKLMAAAGLYLGWQYSMAGFMIGMCIAGIYGIYLLAVKRAKARQKVRLVPFLVYGLATVSLFGKQIINALLNVPLSY
ncbi:MAG: prepilin peptidase [Clostridiales bacterium]|nr:prepilin peptidase [Clostridiales bacterium]